jgi:hypothetical protein
MIIKFDNPCPSGTLEGSSFLNKSKVKISTEEGDEVVSPYEGKVTKMTSDSLTITHNVQGDKWVSKLNGFHPILTLNQHVFKGKQIGYAKNGKLTYDVEPNVNVTDLLTIGVESSKYQGKNSNEEPPPSDSKDPLDALLKVFLSPASFVNGALNLNKKGLNEQETQEKTTLIKEEINRMKKLF